MLRVNASVACEPPTGPESDCRCFNLLESRRAGSLFSNKRGSQHMVSGHLQTPDSRQGHGVREKALTWQAGAWHSEFKD